MEGVAEKILAYLGDKQAASAHDLEAGLSVPRSTLHRYLARLVRAGRVVKAGEGAEVVYALPGKMPAAAGKAAGADPPLVDIKITNPVTYLKLWWKKVVANEGVDIRLKIRPLTALMLAAMLAGVGFGVGRWTLPASSPIVKYIPQLGPSPAPDPWKETAFTGTLRYTAATQRYYLTTGEGEAITLQVPSNVNMSKLVGKRIFATGRYNSLSGVLVVAEAEDLEILPTQVVPVPTTFEVVPTSSATSQ